MDRTCKQSISQNELFNYLETFPEKIGIFYKKIISPRTTSLVCLMFDDGMYYEYVANVQISNNVALVNLNSGNTELSSNEGLYDLIWKTYQEESVHGNEIFFDIATSYNTYLSRRNCNEKINNYSKNKINDEFYNNINNFSEPNSVTFLNMYLGVNAIILGDLQGYDLLRDYYLNEDVDIENFNVKLENYNSSTINARNDIINNIDDILVTL